jgi:SAM-dependent methyltransferase
MRRQGKGMPTEADIDHHIEAKSRRISAILDLLELNDPGTILDIATGDAVVPMVLRRYFPRAEILAVDRDIAFAEQLLARRHVHRITLLQRDLAATGLEANSIDLAILYQVLHHLSVEDGHECFTEIARVLKSTGKVIIVESAIESLNAQQAVWLDLHLLEADIDGALGKQAEAIRSRADIEALLTRKGFSIDRCRECADIVDRISCQSVEQLGRELREDVAVLPEVLRSEFERRLTRLLSVACDKGASSLPLYAMIASQRSES